MKRIRLIYFFLFIACQFTATAQNRISDHNRNAGMYDPDDPMNPNRHMHDEDSTDVEIVSLAPKLYSWHLSTELGNIVPVPVDTMSLQFQNTNLVEGINGHYNHLGNLGAPRQSRIFSDRRQYSSSLFLNPFDYFVEETDKHYFTNSNIPYSNITYYKTFDKQYGEERLKTYFSVNVNKEFAFGFNFDYLYGRGYYQNQSTSYLKAGLFGSYVGDKYRAHIIYNAYNMKMKENGGITDDRYITDPTLMAGNKKEYKPQDIPVTLSNTWNYNKNFYIYLTHRYRLGFYREIEEQSNDSLSTEEFVPVTSFIHTFKIERSRHNFISKDDQTLISPNNYLDHTSIADDTTTYVGIKNTFGIALLEGFNKYAKAGLTAFVSHKVSKYDLMTTDPTKGEKYTEQEFYVGGELLKREGHVLHYKAIGEAGIGGKATGQFKVEGDMDLNFKLFKDTVNFMVRGSVSNTLPAFYMRHYHSKYFWWDNPNMDKEFRSRVEGELNIERWGTNLRAGIENIKNYTYFGSNATPVQFEDNIQVVTARLSQNFKFGILHLDNEVVWQKSSNENVLPLPDLSLYHNLYIDAKLAKKVLSLQLGVDVRYFSKYNAPTYSPGIQNFHLQSPDATMEIGGYPFVNVYANFHLKRTRFFIMMSHINKGMSDPNYFLAPHYPTNQMLMKFGLSWNFYD
ncbi:putative porin [Bacteroides sp. OttesenSCG-928-F21]|nr:putative porin [Bacteroides sp. OttesenSCG-928-F21]